MVLQTVAHREDPWHRPPRARHSRQDEWRRPRGPDDQDDQIATHLLIDPAIREPGTAPPCRPVRPDPEPFVGSRAPHEPTTVHYGHEYGSDPGRITRSEP